MLYLGFVYFCMCSLVVISLIQAIKILRESEGFSVKVEDVSIDKKVYIFVLIAWFLAALLLFLWKAEGQYTPLLSVLCLIFLVVCQERIYRKLNV